MHLFELSPNCSLSSRSANLVLLSVAAVLLAVAGFCALVGLWPILPFAGLELLILWAALGHSLRQARRRESICIDAHQVTVCQSCGRQQREYRFARPWARIRLQPAAVTTWPSRLLVGAMGRDVEVGAFLTEGERRRLRRRLHELLSA